MHAVQVALLVEHQLVIARVATETIKNNQLLIHVFKAVLIIGELLVILV